MTDYEGVDMAKGSRIIAAGRPAGNAQTDTRDPIQRFFLENFHKPGAMWAAGRAAELQRCGVEVDMDMARRLLAGAPVAVQQQRTQRRREGHHDPLVYFIAFGDRIKIGTSTNLRLRLAAIPHDEVLATMPGNFRTEGRMHKRFAHLRVTGEWFERGDDLLDYIAGLRLAVAAS